MAKAPPPTYTIIRDTREQNGWSFPVSSSCLGVKDKALKTGDYTLIGFEDKFVIERKRNLAEIVNNLREKRFFKELNRLDDFDFPYLFLEFTRQEIVNFPYGSGIPQKIWPKIRVTPQFLMMKLHEIQLEHPKLHIEFVGQYGREVASSLFKRIVEYYGKKQ